MDSEYVKALNRRAVAYEHLGKYSEALLDFTASCIIDGFSKESSRNALERLLKKVAEKKAKEIMAAKGKKLPSATFVTNYLQSFRPKPLPESLDVDDLDEETGKGQLRKGYLALQKKTADGYEEASQAFSKALELGDLGDLEGDALNMRATFTYLQGDAQAALADLNKSIEVKPSLVQSYIKRASLHLELGMMDLLGNASETLTIMQETRMPRPMISSWLLHRTRTIRTSTITGPSCTLSSASSPKRPKTTKSPLTSTAASSTLTSSWV